MIFKATKKPVTIEAIKLEATEKSIRLVLNFIGKEVKTNSNMAWDAFESYCKAKIDEGGIVIKTLEGEHIASFGDVIIKGVNGEFYPCKPEIFDKTYDY